MTMDRRYLNRYGPRGALEAAQASGWPPNFGGALVSPVHYELGPIDTGDWMTGHRVDVGGGDNAGTTMFP